MQEEDVDFSDLSICSEELKGGKSTSTVERMIKRIQEQPLQNLQQSKMTAALNSKGSLTMASSKKASSMTKSTYESVNKPQQELQK